MKRELDDDDDDDDDGDDDEDNVLKALQVHQFSPIPFWSWSHLHKFPTGWSEKTPEWETQKERNCRAI